MTESRNVVEQLLPRVRAGEEAARAELFEHLKPSLRRAAERQRQRHPGGKSTETLLAETIHEAERRFAEFQGTSQAAVRAWLMDILAQIAHSPADAEEDPDATISPGSAAATTLAKAVSDSAVSSPPAAAADDPHGTIPADSPAARELAKAVSDSAAIPPTPAETPPSQPDAADTLAVAGRDADATIAPDANATMAGATPKPAAPPAKTFGDYDILKTIAKGGMGVVYKARQRKLNRIVALKMILAGQFADQADVDRFYTEAQAAGKLDHKNIVGIHEVGECDGQHFFSMQYVEGQGLDSMVRERPLAPRVAARYMRKIAAAMQHAHELGVLHRDLKPANILVDQRDEPLITDFGLAKRADDQSQVTMAGTIMGTASYMPPEQASGNLDAISAKSDVYSLGATLYELLTGRPPFGAASVWETIKQVKESEPVSPRVLNPSVPADLETICLKCLQKEPARRYATAQELVEELERYLAGEPILARPVGPVERGWRWCKRNPRIAGSIAAIFVVLLGAAIVSNIFRSRAVIAQTQAETSLDEARDAFKFLIAVSGNDLKNIAGAQRIRSELLVKAKDSYLNVQKQVLKDERNPDIQLELADTYYFLGDILQDLENSAVPRNLLEDGLATLERLKQDSPDYVDQPAFLSVLGKTQNLLGEVLIRSGQLADAAVKFDEAIATRTRLLERTPRGHSDYMALQGYLYNSEMNSGLANKELSRATQGQAQEDLLKKAKERLTSSQEGRRRLLGQTPQVAKLHLDAAIGARALAELAFERAEAISFELEALYKQADAGDANSKDATEQAKLEEDEFAQAEVEFNSLLREAFSELDVLQGQGATELQGFDKLDRFQIKYLRAICLLLAGNMHFHVKAEDRQAQEDFEAAGALLEGLTEENPDVRAFRSGFAGAMLNLGITHRYLGEFDEAIRCCRLAEEEFEKLGDDAGVDAARQEVKNAEEEKSEAAPPDSSEPNPAEPADDSGSPETAPSAHNPSEP